MLTVLLNLVLPLIAGAVYFVMAFEIKRVSAMRKFMFGEIGYNKVFTAFMLFGIYFATRPLQNLAAHPWPMLVNSLRQSFLMAIIAPSILVGIFHWVPREKGAFKSADIAAFTVGCLMAAIFIMINISAVTGSKVIASFGTIKLYDPMWFADAIPRPELVVIHLIAQLISPVGFFLLAAGYVRHRRHNYPLSHIYTNMTLKWKYLETGLLLFAISMIVAGLAALLGKYYTYLWVIYFLAAVVAGLFELKGVTIPPVHVPTDLDESARTRI